MKVSGGGGGVGGGGELVRNSLRTFRENLGRMGTDLTSFRTVLLDGLASEGQRKVQLRWQQEKEEG